MRNFVEVLIAGVMTAIAALVVYTILVATTMTPAEASLWTAYKNSQLEAVSSQAYRVEAQGFDFRVYEWTPKSSPDTTCVASFATDSSVGMHCFHSEK